MDTPDTGIEVKDFLGKVSNAGPDVIPPGAAAEQINCRTHVPGKLQVRGGLKLVSFTNSVTVPAYAVMGMYNFQTQLGQFVVYQTNDGHIRAGRGIS